AHDALLESTSSKPYEESSSQVPEGSVNLNSIASTFNPSAEQIETLTVESPIPNKEDGIFLSQDKYIGDILKKFGFSDIRSSNTPMDKENPWGKDGPGKDVELHLY
nr:hypothetical protein [Tanacetum cinerariifolium]